MFDRVNDVIRKFNMINGGERIVAAVSGGADSMAMLHILRQLSNQLSFDLYAAHLNHNLRGDDAKRDAELVDCTCREWVIPLFFDSIEVKDMSKNLRISEEEAGRKARYAFFDKVLAETNGDKLALAHHQGDRVETILHNIIRGTGIKGLQGINYVRNGFIIRPLLDVSKEEILRYCKDNKVNYREDMTNFDQGYTRNRIRHGLIPYIRDHFNPAIEDALLRLSCVSKEEDDFLENHCGNIMTKHFEFSKGKGNISLDFFLSQHVAVKRRLLRLAIQKLNHDLSCIELFHIDSIISMLEDSRHNSAIHLSNNIRAGKDYGFAWVSVASESKPIERYEYALEIPGEIFIPEFGVVITAALIDDRKISYGKNPVYIDADALQGSLVVRNRKKGDRFKPLGMNAYKKLKNYFIDKKISREQRDYIPLVQDESGIIWVVGHEINEDFKITKNTQRILRLSVNNINQCNKGEAVDENTD